MIVLLDEISWMGSRDPAFPGKLKTAWDTQFKKNDKLILVLCGSASTWIERNILSSTGFVGRVSRTLTLEELPLRDCASFWPDADGNVSPYEKAKILAVTGGIPRYLEEVDTNRSSEENIKRLCFSRGGLLVTELALDLDVNSIVNENPYFQTPTSSRSGCQIDFMIQAKFSCPYVCEIRFSTKPLGADVIREVQSRIARLKRPKHFSCRPVLFHINGVTQELADGDYFAHVVDVSGMLQAGGRL